MADLDFTCIGATPDPTAATPTILLRLQVAETTGTRVDALALRTQLRIEPTRRGYTDTEADALRDLFGERSRWGSTQRPLQLAFLNQVVPGFAGVAEVDLALPCSYDFDVAANKFLYAVDDGEIPLLLLFSGMLFTAGPNGFGVEPVPWHKEARYRLPVRVWQQTMQLHFPNSAWLRLGQDAFDALYRYRTGHDLVSWDEAIERLLKEAER